MVDFLTNEFLGARRKLDIARATLSAVRLVKIAADTSSSWNDFQLKLAQIETRLTASLGNMEDEETTEMVEKHQQRVDSGVGDSLNEPCERTI